MFDFRYLSRNLFYFQSPIISHHLFQKFICGLVLVSADAVSLRVKYPTNNNGEEEDIEEYNAKDGKMVKKENSQRFCRADELSLIHI